MSQLSVTTIKSLTASTPPVIQDSAGTQIGTFCRAWVNFNGTGTVAIRAAFNVSSVTDNGVGDYTVNFSTAMSDANYSAVFGDMGNVSVAMSPFVGAANYATRVLAASLRVVSFNTGAAQDSIAMNVAIFR